MTPRGTFLGIDPEALNYQRPEAMKGVRLIDL